MWSRNVFRATKIYAPFPIGHAARRYTSEPGKPSRSFPALTIAGGALALGGGYYFLTSPPQQLAVSTAQTRIPSGEKAFKGGDQGFLSLKLESVENVSHNTKRFRFSLPEDDMQSGLSVAAALLSKYKGPEMDKAVVRPYTPVSDEDAVGFFDLVVKKYPDGPMSTHLHDMKPGQRLEFKGPLPKYPMEPNKHNHICLIAGGTGITPMYQLMRYVFSHPEDTTKVTLVFGNISQEDILLRKELEELENHYPQRFRAFFVLDKPPQDWQGGKGFITKDLLKTVLPEPKEDNIKVFICGPPGLYKAISGTKKSPKDQGDLSGVLKEMGYTEEQVFKF